MRAVIFLGACLLLLFTSNGWAAETSADVRLDQTMVKLAAAGRLNLLFDNVVGGDIETKMIKPLTIEEAPLDQLQALIDSNKLFYVQVDRRTIMLVKKNRDLQPIYSLPELVARADKLDSINDGTIVARKFILHDYTFRDATIATIIKTIAESEKLNVVMDSIIASLVENKKINFQLKNVTAPRALQILLNIERLAYQQTDRRTILITVEAMNRNVFNSPLEEIITRAEEDDLLANRNVEPQIKPLAPLQSLESEAWLNIINSLAQQEQLDIIYSFEAGIAFTHYHNPFVLNGVAPLRAIELLFDTCRLTYTQVGEKAIAVVPQSRNLAAPLTLAEIANSSTDKGKKPTLHDYNFQDEPLDKILQIFAAELKINIVYEDCIAKVIAEHKASFSLKNVTAAHALKNILSAQRFCFNQLDRRTIALSPEARANWRYSRPLEEVLAWADEAEAHNGELSFASHNTDTLLKLDNEFLTKKLKLEDAINQLAAAGKLQVQFTPEAQKSLQDAQAYLQVTNLPPLRTLEVICELNRLGYLPAGAGSAILYRKLRLLDNPIRLERIAADKNDNEPTLRNYDYKFVYTPVRVILATMAEPLGLNIIYEDAIARLVEMKKIDLQLQQSTAVKALETVINAQNFCFTQVDAHTIMIAPGAESNCEYPQSIEDILKR